MRGAAGTPFVGITMKTNAIPSPTQRSPAVLLLGWRLLIGLPLLLFAMSIPARYQELAGMARRLSAELGPEYGGLQGFLAGGTYYALGVLFLEVIFVISLVLTSLAIVWSNQVDWRSLFFSAVFVFYPVWVTPTLDALTLPPVLQAIANLTQAAGVVLAVMFFLLFPDGRFVPGWTRVSATAWLLYCLAWGLSPASWFSLIDPFEASFPAFLVLLLLGWGLGLAVQAIRYRQAPQWQRVMTKWVLLVVAGACVGYAIVYLPGVFLPESGSARALYDLFAVPVFWLLALPMPVALAVAMQRYHLFDVKFILQRTLVYGALTASVVGLYVLVMVGVGALVHSGGNFLVSLFATGLVAVLFTPLRNRLQRGVNHLMYGERNDPYTVLSQLSRRLEATFAPDAVLSTAVRAVAEALKLPYAAIELERNGTYEIMAETGEPAQNPLRLPLLYAGESVGQLVLGRRSGETRFTDADRYLFDDLARQIGVAVHAARMTEDAIKLSADLQKSRERIVAAREEERRRIRRDLHDGLGPQLATLTLKLDAARNLLHREPRTADTLLAGLKVQGQAAISDIRQLVYDLRPPALDELGLVPAIREQAANYSQYGLNITVQAPERLPPLPAAVEVAAYRIAQEALTNVARHAQAKVCRVRLSLGGELELEITDDGIGLPEDRRAGVGLSSMRERAAELGGTCVVEPAGPAGGTRLLARLPLPAPGDEP